MQGAWLFEKYAALPNDLVATTACFEMQKRLGVDHHGRSYLVRRI